MEHNGYEKYGEQKVLDYPEYKKGGNAKYMKKEPISYDGKRASHRDFKTKPFNRGRYMVIAGGSSRLSNNLEEELKQVTSSENKYGKLQEISDIGDGVQSMLIHNDKLFVIVNNSHLIKIL